MDILEHVDNSISFCDDLERSDFVAEILKALAHPLRIRIVAILADEGPQNVGDLENRLGAKQSIVSQQLRILRMHGVVVAVREGGFARYHLAMPQLKQLVRCMKACAIK